MSMDIGRWIKHFNTKKARSTEMVEVPQDVFDFLCETIDAFSNWQDSTNPSTVATANLLALQLLNEIKARQHQ